MTAPFDARSYRDEHRDDYPPFAFTDLAGNRQELKHPLNFTQRQIEEFGKVDQEDEEAMMNVFAKIASPEAVEAIRDMEMYVVQGLMAAWNDEAGDAGKSPSTSPPTNREQRRSQKTSLSGGKTSKR